MDKETVRKEARRIRSELPDDYRAAASNDIVQQLIELARDVNTILTFEPMLDKNEVDIRAFNEWAAQQPDKQLHVQNLTGDFPDIQFDLIIVPGLAFDSMGNRIGYGGGHYDRFLIVQRTSMKAGVCFSSQLVEKILIEQHDVPVQIVVTDNI